MTLENLECLMPGDGLHFGPLEFSDMFDGPLQLHQGISRAPQLSDFQGRISFGNNQPVLFVPSIIMESIEKSPSGETSK